LGLGGGWGLYEPPQEENNNSSSGFLAIWFAVFLFVIVFSVEMALVK
jgi:hypothetical protein